MSSKDFVSALAKGSNLDAEDAFKTAMSQRIGDALETKRKDVAGSMIKQHIPDTEEKEEFYNAIQFEQAYPIFNLSLARALDIPIEEPIRPINKYQKYVALINNFAINYLFTEDFKALFPFKTDTFIDVPLNRINHIDPQVGLLEFGKDQYGNKCSSEI